MGKLIYDLNVSLDGYIVTPDHSLDWANVDEELHTWFNDRAREMDTLLYGRRLYEVMAAYWPTAASDPTARPLRHRWHGITMTCAGSRPSCRPEEGRPSAPSPQTSWLPTR